MNRGFLAVLIGMVSVSAASCGIPIDSTATELPQVVSIVEPVDSTSNTLDRSSPATVMEPAARGVILYFVRGDGLVGRGAVLGVGYSAQNLLQLLVTGPSTDDSAGLRSALGQRPDLIEMTEVSGAIAVVDLAASLSDLPGTEQVLVLGQTTLTLVANLEIEGVVFRQNGNPVVVPGADGQPVSGVVSRTDYAPLLARP